MATLSVNMSSEQKSEAIVSVVSAKKNPHCPLIINHSEFPLIVYQSRAGFIFNKQCLYPGEALSISSNETGSILWYDLTAEIGDEKCIPGRLENLKSVATATAVPAAFCVAALAAAVTAGALVGPSAALAPLVSGLVVNGVVIDAAAITAGVNAAGGARIVIERLLEKKGKAFLQTTVHRITPRGVPKVFIVRGGMTEALIMEEAKKSTDRQRFLYDLGTLVVKHPIR